MFLKVVVPVLALSIVAAPGYAQTTAAQPASPFAQANPNASLLASMPDMGTMLSSFFSTANRPTTGDKPDVLIQRAQTAYNDKRYKDAMTALQLAQDALRRQHMDYYAGLLPPAHGGGWTLEEAKPEDTICFGEQICGGVAALSRGYTNNGQKVKITYVTDAPIMSRGFNSEMHKINH